MLHSSSHCGAYGLKGDGKLLKSTQCLCLLCVTCLNCNLSIHRSDLMIGKWLECSLEMERNW